MPTPRVTASMIFLDPGVFFRDAIDSVLAQSFGDLELLLVDDGSTDGSSEVAQDAAAHDQRVRYLHHNDRGNHGTGASRALGLDQARGEFLTSLDADDVWTQDAIERQVAHLERDPSLGMVIGSTCYWRSWDPAEERGDRIEHVGPVGRRPAPRSAIELVSRRGFTAPSMNAVMVRTEAARNAGGFPPGFPSLYEDQAFLFAVLLLHPVCIHRQVIDRYRQHEASTYARGLASGEDALTGPSEARRRFERFALGHLERVHSERFSDEEADTIAAALAAATSGAAASSPAARTVEQARRQGRRVLRRAGREIKAHTPVSLARFLPHHPVSTRYGYDRGTPVDRIYIESFLRDHELDIRGAALEIGDPEYTRRFGGDRVTTSDVLHITAGHPATTIVGDLTDAPHIEDERFGCVVFTQTLHLIYDVEAALATLHRILKPGGVLLMTVPSLSPMTEQEGWGHYWNFTGRSVERLMAGSFGPLEAIVDVQGNVAAATAFLYGYAAEELKPEVLATVDRRYPVTITTRARRVA